MPSIQTDLLLLQDIKEGNEKAFETLFLKYYKELCVYGCRYLQDKDKVEELVSDVFMIVWDRRATLEITKDLKSYLFISVKNRCFNLLGSKQFKQAALETDIGGQPDRWSIDPYNEIHYEEIYQGFVKSLEQMPTKRREIFELNKLEGLGYREIAERLNLSEKTVKNQVFRAVKFLKEYSFLLLFFWK